MNKIDALLDEMTISGSRPGLERINELITLLGHPERNLKIIHVAGTNGKGSLCNMLSSILAKSGYKTGLFTSPYIYNYREYFNIDGEIISENELFDLISEIKSLVMKMCIKPTIFELFTGLVFRYFEKKQCEFAVIECGMGGLYDATNFIKAPEMSVITNIGMDHMGYLGDSIEKIAFHKAGIIKENNICVCYPSEFKAVEIVKKECIDKNCQLIIPDFDNIYYEVNRGSKFSELKLLFSYRNESGLYSNINLHNSALYQTKNAAMAIESASQLIHLGYKITTKNIIDGIESVKMTARFEQKSENPVIITDGGHNVQCIEAFTQSLDVYFPGIKFVIVTGVMKDKDFNSMFEILKNYASSFIAVQPENERALVLEDLVTVLSKTNLPVYSENDLHAAIGKAVELAGKDGYIAVIGSFYMIKDLF